MGEGSWASDDFLAEHGKWTFSWNLYGARYLSGWVVRRRKRLCS